MNEDHIRAVLKSSTFIKTSKYEDKPLVTNGHLACVLEWDTPDNYHQLAGFWQRWLQTSPRPCGTGELLKESDSYSRKFVNAGINEAFYRCFAGPSVTWTETGDNTPVLAHESGELIALVMPMRSGTYGEAIQEVGDAEVFEKFACEANDYYPLGVQGLKREIENLSSDLDTARDRMDEAQCEVDELKTELDRKRAVLNKLKVKA